MRRVVATLILVVSVMGAGVGFMAFQPLDVETVLIDVDGDVGRGAYLARMSGCIACHTDVIGKGAPLSGGLALKTTFGDFFTPNLTTSQLNGIGNWTVEQFAVAVRQGISPSGQPYYPSFPYAFYSGFSDQDIADLWAAFQTVPPVETANTPHDMRFPFGIRRGLNLWRTAFYRPSSVEPDPKKSDIWNRGKFIVEGPAHCGACHTPRNFAGARQAEQSLHGSDALPTGGKSPPITSAHLSSNGWTIKSLKFALKTGVLPDGDAFGAEMGEVVRDNTSFLTDDDLTAIATYLMER